MKLPEPGPDVVEPAARFLDYLDYFRAEVRRKVRHMQTDPARNARTASATARQTSSERSPAIRLIARAACKSATPSTPAR